MIVTAWKAFYEPSYIIATVISTVAVCVLRACRRGIFREFFTLLRFIGSLLLAWYFSAAVGSMLGLPLMLAAISGFYLIFLVLFLGSGFLSKFFISNKEEISIPAKLLGAMLGGFEGVIVAWILVFTLAMLPNSRLADYYSEFSQFSAPVENMLAPIIPEQAAQSIELVKTVQRISSNFKPEKVDRQALQEIITPLAEMPEITALQEDAGIRELVENRDFKGLLNHPALRNFLESEELRQRMQNIDLKKLERALVPDLYKHDSNSR